MDQIDYGTVELADSSDHLVEDFRLDGQALGDVRQAIRAAHAQPIKRGNVSRRIALVVVRPGTHASAAAARLFLATHEADLGAETATTITHTVGGTTITYHDVIVSHSAVQTGTTTRHSYTITCGEITTAPVP